MDELKEEFNALFTAFLPQQVATRFTQLLDLQPKRWAKIDPWLVWSQSSSHITEWPRGLMFREVHKWPAMAALSNRRVAILRCGHDQPSLSAEPLASIFSGQANILEGFISVERGALGLAFNHSGGVRVLATKPLTPLQGLPVESTG